MEMYLLRKALMEKYTYFPETGDFKFNTGRKMGRIVEAKNPGGYRLILLDGKQRLAHRMAWLYVHAWIPDMMDHIDGDPSNNKIDNLRPCTPAENIWNSKSKTGDHKAVYVDKFGYYFVITKNGSSAKIGHYTTREEAAEASLIARRLAHGEFARSI